MAEGRFGRGYSAALAPAVAPRAGSLHEDAISALLNLGYPRHQASRALERAASAAADADLPALLTRALAELAR